MIGPATLVLAASFGWPIQGAAPEPDAARGFPNGQAYAAILSDPLYFQALLSSAGLAITSAVIALGIGFPIAYWIARKPEPLRSILLAAVSLPLWVSFLVRVYAWMILLGTHGPISSALAGLGLTDGPQSLLHTRSAACVGIAYSYLPFVVFPIYASLSRSDPSLEEAAADLGATPIGTFWRVTLPLARPGMIAGALLITVPALGEFVIPELLGSSDTLTLGRVLWSEFFDNRDWAISSALAVLLLLFTCGIVLLTNLFRRSRESA